MSFFDSFKRFCRIIAGTVKIVPNTPPPASAPQKTSATPIAIPTKQTVEHNSQLLPPPFDFSKSVSCDEHYDAYPELKSNNYRLLHERGFEYEKEGKTDLAVLCMKKASAILRKIKCYDTKEYYPLVEILARAGRIEEAKNEKLFIDRLIAYNKDLSEKKYLLSLDQDCAYYHTDFVIMSANRAACSECAKYQGRVYSRTGKDSSFPKIPDELSKRYKVHSGCSHQFYAYTPGISSDNLETTLCFHPLINPDYGKDIVTFSNRPFLDDRTEDAKIEAENLSYKLNELREREENYYANIVEIEAQRGQEIRDYTWLQENLSDKCPKSISGYRRMKTMNTKNYQLLKELASQKGREIL